MISFLFIRSKLKEKRECCVCFLPETVDFLFPQADTCLVLAMLHRGAIGGKLDSIMGSERVLWVDLQRIEVNLQNSVVVSNIFHVFPYLGR